VGNIVLVLGVWADGSGWRGVYDILIKDGYTSASCKSRDSALPRASATLRLAIGSSLFVRIQRSLFENCAFFDGGLFLGRMSGSGRY